MSSLTIGDLRYLSMIAWRQGTRRGDDVAVQVDAILDRLITQTMADDNDTDWIPPYAKGGYI